MAGSDTSKIFESIKKALGLQPENTPFDDEILMHINSVMSDLNQLGVGPKDGFLVDQNTAWSALLTNSKLENVKSYMFLRVKMLFDLATMPQPVIAAYQKQVDEAAWRITNIADPMIPQLVPELDEDEELILDGGDA